MSKPFHFGAAVSTVVLASMIGGCAAPQRMTGFGGKAQGDVGLATRALAALNSNDIPLAINLAERAVEKTPDDAGFRALLGNAYFAAGRFHSAEAAFKDSLTIYSNQPRVVLRLALVEIAQGRNDEAVTFLQAGRSVIDASDYGLALALAGRTEESIPILQAAAREQGADARVRQNLALAYALAGNWTEARTVAAQDVPANQLDARIQQWMQLANPKKASDQVAALVGVTPAASDQGEPVQLALRKSDTLLAEAAPAPQAAPVAPPVAQVAPAPQPEFAEAAPAPAAPVSLPTPAPEPVMAEAPVPSPVTMIAAAAREVTSAVKSLIMPDKPAARPKARQVAAVHHGNSKVVMQIASYGAPQQVTAGWNRLTERFPALRSYLPVRARFDSAKGTFWRLSVQGFASEREAMARCAELKSEGGKCFVRGAAGDAPMEIASR
jgi:D-alanyl-D-alanine carboxypeptidase